jgi:hypothetical protein
LKKPRSKKHHYLPRYYLKGFTDRSNFFYIYDKKEDIILSNPISPDNFFFENNLNTIVLQDGTYSDFLEDFYTQIEVTTRSSLSFIRNSGYKTPIPFTDKMNLYLFLLFLYWRLPSNIEYCNTLSNTFFNDNFKDLNYLNIKNKNGETAPNVIIDRIKISNAFKKTSKLIIPFAPFYKSDWSDKLKNWRFLYSGDGNIWDFVGDNPFITKGKNDHDPISCLDEFVFPVSGKILLVNMNKPINKDLPPEFTIDFNASVIERSQRFVACQNKPFLESLIKYYKFHVQNEKTGIIIKGLYKMLEN